MSNEAELLVHLKRHRQAAGLTQQALAESVGVTRQTIISIERGRYRPSIMLALQLASVFEVTVEELFELEVDHGD